MEISKNNKLPSLFLVGLIVIALVIPTALAISDYFFSANPSSLNSAFFTLLLRSLTFGVSQAFVSSLLACLIGGCLGFILCNAPQKIRALLSTSANLLFILPGTAIALLTLSTINAGNVDSGISPWQLIVFSHVLWSCFFIANQVVQRSRQDLNGKGSRLLLVALNSGARPTRAAFAALRPAIFYELKQWAPLVFSWSFTSFSTVLLLGNGPQHATPEVMLYFTLMNDLSPARILVLLGVNLTLQFIIFFRLIFSKKSEYTNFSTHSGDGFSKPFVHNLFTYLGAAISTIPLILIGRLALSSFSKIPHSDLSLILNSLLPSIAYSMISAIFVTLLTLALIASPSSLRKKCFFLFALSPTLVSAVWIDSAFSDWLWQRPLESFLFCSALLATLQIPLAAFWLNQELGRLSERSLKRAQSLGLTPAKTYWHFLIPACLPTIKKLFFYCFVIALGEVAIATVWLSSWPNLALLSRRFSENYSFSSASLIFSLNLLIALVLYVLLFGIQRPKTKWKTQKASLS